MFNLLFADRFSLGSIDLWYAVPAIIAISLVYAATRHERIGSIFLHAGRVVVWITGFMAAVFAMILFVSRLL